MVGLLKIVYRLSDWVFRIEKVLAVIFGATILISLSAGVIYRYFLKVPLLWSDEMAIFCLAWITFIGGSMGIKQNASPSITMLTDLLKGKVKKVVLIVGFLILVAFLGYVLYLSINWLSSPNILVQKSNSMQMPKIWSYLCIPISFAFMLIHSLELLVKGLSSSDGEAA